MPNEKLEVRNEKPVIKYQLQAIRCFPTTLNLEPKTLNFKY
ncbi:hypothetical protein JOE44_004314 [Chryseobacterium sp. PvR013]|nr:hypothetical protein [Chryseobacterium sp. PvR013]